MWGIIYLIRHTRLKIKEGICYGSTDIDLADSFLEEAELIREKFKDMPIGRVYCSPLNRCKKLAECFKRRIIFDNRLIEMDFGDWEGVSWNEVFQ
jgi:alpha-ribazole phosphatase